MNKVFNLKSKANILGVVASSLCLVHCLATPFLFTMYIGQRGHGHSQPFWWGTLDILFIYISLFSVYWSAKNTSKNWMRYALWICWVLLTIIIVNEKLEILELMEELIYLPSISLVLLHLYNRRYCKCMDDNCCASSLKNQTKINKGL